MTDATRPSGGNACGKPLRSSNSARIGIGGQAALEVTRLGRGRLAVENGVHQFDLPGTIHGACDSGRPEILQCVTQPVTRLEQPRLHGLFVDFQDVRDLLVAAF